jgi:hypothetical protein
MLSASRYLLGVAEIVLLTGFATLGANQLRRRLLPDFSGAPAHLATAVLALAILLWVAELLGSFGLFAPVPYLVAVGAIGTCLGVVGRRTSPPAASPAGGAVGGTAPEEASATAGGGGSPAATGLAGQGACTRGLTLIAVLIAAAAVIHFAAGVRLRLGTGMTGFDSTWYHGPLAANFFQSGDTWDLHFIAPQFLAWFYPANAEIFHAVGMLAFHRDLLSPLLNLGWLIGCLFAVWCIGRPFGVAPLSLALGAIALSVPALADQAGEARNDLAATFFLLAAAAIALNARWLPAASSDRRSPDRGKADGGVNGEAAKGRGMSTGALMFVGLAAGLAGGTKLNFLLPAAVFVVGLALAAPSGARWRALAATGLGALAGSGYWYLRNLAHSGSPLPWLRHLGPITLPGPTQPLGGRQGHSVLSYLGDGSVWSSWFLPGLHDGLSALWPFLAALTLAGLLLCLGRRAGPVLRVLAFVGLAAAVAWLVSPTSAEGPPGVPRGFESGLRYLAPVLALGLALLPTTPPLRARLRRWRLGTAVGRGGDAEAVNEGEAGSGAKGAPSDVVLGAGRAPVKAVPRNRFGVAAVALLLLAAIAIGYPVERHYLRNRYARPEFTTPGLDAAFKWARSISGARIATTATRQYPLLGTDLSNHVQFVGIERPHGGFVAPATCRAWRLALDAGHYDYAVVTRDRIEPGKPAYPPAARWTEGLGVTVLLRKPPTVIFKLTTPLDPSACRR